MLMCATTRRREAESKNMRLLLNWLLSAIGLLIVSYFMPGFHVSGFGAALLAALVIGLVNATLGLFLKIITLPLTILTLGIFWWVINALMLLFASHILSPKFVVTRILARVPGRHRAVADQRSVEGPCEGCRESVARVNSTSGPS